MKANLKKAILFNSLLLFPFATLELTLNKQANPNDFIALFGFLLILATAFIFILLSVGHGPNAPRKGAIIPARIVLGIVALGCIAIVFGTVMADQMPGFMGHPNCD